MNLNLPIAVLLILCGALIMYTSSQYMASKTESASFDGQ